MSIYTGLLNMHAFALKVGGSKIDEVPSVTPVLCGALLSPLTSNLTE